MGQKQSYQVANTAEQEQPAPSSLMLYTLHFVCSTMPINESEKPIDRILYAENWCLNESLWKTYITNAIKDIEIEQTGSSSPGKRTKLTRLRIYTKIHGEVVFGSVKWISNDVDIDMLDKRLKADNENMFEKGLYFIEAFWTTAIYPHMITKTPAIAID